MQFTKTVVPTDKQFVKWNHKVVLGPIRRDNAIVHLNIYKYFDQSLVPIKDGILNWNRITVHDFFTVIIIILVSNFLISLSFNTNKNRL